MKAIGIPQPGAWLIINGYHDRIPLPEPTSHRGRVLIYAHKEPVTPTAFERFVAGCRQLRVSGHPKKAADLELAGFLGTAQLIDCEIDPSGQAVAVIEDAEELGFVSARGSLGIFGVRANPFRASGSSYTPDYSSYSTDPTGPSPQHQSHAPARSDDYTDEPSALDHLLDGAQKQYNRELNKLGRQMTKGAIDLGIDLLTGWLGGGTKPSKGRRR